jgi:hypothetical protein
MRNEVRLEPGWLMRDLERADQRVGEWSRGKYQAVVEASASQPTTEVRSTLLVRDGKNA